VDRNELRGADAQAGVQATSRAGRITDNIIRGVRDDVDAPDGAIVEGNAER